MSTELIEQVNSPQDLKLLNYEQLNEYSLQARAFISETVRRQGGHLSSNLGTVELTVALHYVFSSPTDKLIWDVGHQAYTHKLITGRREGFKHLRQNNGLSGFPNTKESEHDVFTSGHSSTSLSSGLGLARARDLTNDNYNVVCVIGDGALTGGMAFEALNDIGNSKKRMIIILNDNEMSISRNVGAISEYLAKLRLSSGYTKFKLNVRKCVSCLPFFGDKLVHKLEQFKNFIKPAFQTKKMFEHMGINYYGPFDGHNICTMVDAFKGLKDTNSPILIHLITNKGNGDLDALSNPSKYHGVAPPEKEKSTLSFSEKMGDCLTELARNDNKITAITAAMCDGTGLSKFYAEFKDRYFDVGIAEQHAVTMAAGLARAGLKPYFAVYSSFLQRAFDQVLHDVALNKLPVTFLIDRGGVIGADGMTHQGVYDLSYLSLIPNMTIFLPKDGAELEHALKFSQTFDAPLAIRYPKSYTTVYNKHLPIELGKWEVLRSTDSKVFLLCAGNRMLDLAQQIDNVNIINARFVKPIDTEFLKAINKKGNHIITLEDNVLNGGFGSLVMNFINAQGMNAKLTNLALKDAFIENLDINEVFLDNFLSKEHILELIKE